MGQNKIYQSLISLTAWEDRKYRNARNKRRSWVKAEMKTAVRKLRRQNKIISIDK